MNTVFIMQAANLFCGDHDPSASKHLTLAELKLPGLQAIYADHHPGGARMAVEFEVGFQKLEPTFKLNGIDPELLIQFGLGSKVKNVYTAYGEILDKRTGRAIEGKAILEARLGKVDPNAFQQGQLMGHDYTLNEVTHYELWIDEKPKIEWDFFTNLWRVDGRDENADRNRILRIPAAV